MSQTTPKCQVLTDDGSGAFATDISTTVDMSAGVSISRGRENWFSTINPSTATFTVDNHSGGAAPAIGTPVRVKTGPSGGSLVTRFTGFVDSCVVQWQGGPAKSSTVLVTCSDVLTRFGRQLLPDAITQELSVYTDIVAHYPLINTIGPASDTSGQNQPDLKGRGSGNAPGWGTGDQLPIDGVGGLQLEATGKYLSSWYGSTEHRGNAALWPHTGLATGETLVVSALVNTTESTTTQTVFEVNNLSGSGQYVAVGLGSNGVVFGYSATTGSGSPTTTAGFGSVSVNDGNFHFISVAFTSQNSGGIAIYVDGVLDSTSYSPNNGVQFPSMTRINIGNGDVISPISGNSFAGTLGHVIVTKTPANIANLSALLLSGFTTDSTDQRLVRYCGYANIGSGARSFETGATTTTAYLNTQGMSVGDAMQEVSDTEDGLLFVRADGVLIFQARTHRPLQTSAVQTFTSDKLEPDAQVTTDTQGMINDSSVTAAGGSGSANEATNATSITSYSRFSEQLTLLFTNDTEAYARASWDASTLSTPVPRIPSGTFDLLTTDSTTAAHALALELSDRFAVTSLPSQSPITTADLVLEGFTETVQYDASSSTWSLTFNASPWSLYEAWILQNATYSVLGTTTRAGQ